MRVRTLIACAALAGTIGSMAFVPAASAQDSIYVPLFTYRTGPFAGSGIPIANGKHDYLDMLNDATAASAASSSSSRNARPATTPRRVSNATSR